MDVDWGAVKDIAQLSGLVLAAAMVLLVMHLRRYFPTREEIARKYVTQAVFSDEMRKLRDDLHAVVASASQHTDAILERGIKQLREEVNGMSPRIVDADRAATSAASTAHEALASLSRTDRDMGRFDSDMRQLRAEVAKVAEGVQFIRGKLEKQEK